MPALFVNERVANMPEYQLGQIRATVVDRTHVLFEKWIPETNNRRGYWTIRIGRKEKRAAIAALRSELTQRRADELRAELDLLDRAATR